jgi:hypothetical protein
LVPAVTYFSPAELTRGEHTCLMPLGQFAIVRACPRVWLRELELVHGGKAGWVHRRVSREEQ